MQGFELCSGDSKELASAMLKVQAALKPAAKDAENPFARSKYASLNSVMEACREALLSQGIWLTQYPLTGELGHLTLVTKLIHSASGQWQASLLQMPLPKADPQGYGSALTYGRRYALSALLGMVTEDDDDAAECSKGSKSGALTASHKSQNPIPHQDHAPEAEEENLSGSAAETSAATNQAILDSMPKLDGVNYETRELAGKLCIIARGQTFRKKSLLSQSGFKWDEQRKVWWRYTEPTPSNQAA